MSPRHPRSPLLVTLLLPWSLMMAVTAAVAAPPQAFPGQNDRPPVRGGAQGQARQPVAPNPKLEARKVPAIAVEEQWNGTLADSPAAPPAVDGASAFVSLKNGDLVAVSLADGAVRWKAAGAGTSEPAAGGGLVFVVSDDGLVTARDAESGKARWEAPLGGKPAGALTWQNGWLVAGNAAGEVVVLRAQDGSVVWRRSFGAPLREHAALTGDRVYLLFQNHRVAAALLENGNPIWIRALGGKGTSLLPLNDRVFVGADDKVFYCLSAGDGRLMWRWQVGGAIVGTPAVDADCVYFLALDNILRAVSRTNGAQQWKRGLELRPGAGPLLVAGLVLVPGVGSEIQAFQTVDGSPAGSATTVGDMVVPLRTIPTPNNPTRPALLVVTGEAQVQRLQPVLPKLAAKPIPKLQEFKAPSATGPEEGAPGVGETR